MHDLIVPTFGLPPHTAVAIYLSLGLVVIAILNRNRLAIVPGKLQNIVEMVFETFLLLSEDMMGHHGKKYVPFILSFFIYILIANAFGMVPGLIPPTANLNTTVGLALIVFISTHIIGVKEHGLKYFKRFAGPSPFLAPLMIPIEVVGHMVRPFSLSMRLFANMMGHEIVSGMLLILMPLGYPLLAFSTVLGIIVVIIQATVFSLLAMAYIGGAVEEEEH